MGDETIEHPVDLRFVLFIGPDPEFYLNADPELDTAHAIRIQNTVVDFDDFVNGLSKSYSRQKIFFSCVLFF
jgi:hypothetical protein